MAEKIICGRNPVFEYLNRAKCNDQDTLFMTKGAHGKVIEDIVALSKTKNIKIVYCTKRELNDVTKESHQGVILRLASKDISGSKSIDGDELLNMVSEKKGVLVLLDQLTDPHNIGSIIRSTEALGADGMILLKSHSPKINSTIVKSSAGATAHLPITYVSNAASFIEKAKKKDFWVIGTTDHGNKDITEISDIRPALVIIGSEGKGMRRLTEEKCDFLVKIPLKGKINSLNASVAAGIILYEVLKEK